jgi:hypothetical protein
MAMNLDFVEKKFEILFFVLVLFCCEEPWLSWESFIKKIRYI